MFLRERKELQLYPKNLESALASTIPPTIYV